MTSRRRENGTSPGVILSATLSIASFALSFFTFYFEHLKSSEAVDAFLSDFSVKKDSSSNIERITVDLTLVNKGDTSVTISDLWFELDAGTGNCCGRTKALKADEDRVRVPSELPSKHATQVSIGFKYGGFIASPFAPRLSSGKENLPTEPIPPPSPTTIEKMSIALSLTTIGPIYGYQEMKTPIGILHIDDGKLRTYGPAFISSELIPIRQDPPLLRSLWRSVTN